MIDYLPIQDYSIIWNISKRRIQVLCKEGRIPGAKMIGNMWVIPEHTDRPVDARVKNPVRGFGNKDSLARKELKKILKKLYASCFEHFVKDDDQKDYVLSIIAAELCFFYLEIESDERVLSAIYKDISGKRENITFCSQDLLMVRDFIRSFQDESELDNILSWAYQYSNKLIHDNRFSKTQFFTERYMIRYLVQNIEDLCEAEKILDPCIGGGNFMTECLEELCNQDKLNSVASIRDYCSRLYGFDIDNKIARIAVINIRLRALAILRRSNVSVGFDIWKQINPNIFVSQNNEMIQGSLTTESRQVRNVISQELMSSKELFSGADVVLTNPPFASVKGMDQDLKDFLKENYSFSNCDTCVAFIQAIGQMLSKNGTCGIVSQSAWMHLKTFDMFRKWIVSNYTIKKIVNLGSGSFQDLSGEKSNVALIVFSNQFALQDHDIQISNADTGSYEEKEKFADKEIHYIRKRQSEINGVNGFHFTEYNLFEELKERSDSYKSIAVPMQGTSTGNARELVGFFWEHFGDNNWVSVSNGGGYCRWQGLNDSVVKWGKDGEYIKSQKGSALRNVKYFPETQMVFSDTGTAGLNVRILRDNQIFIASGPGIRIKKGNEYAHLALLNSRIASYYIRLLSPKLTIAAGYISQIPVNNNIYSSIVLEKNAKLCVELKKKMLSVRTSNLEYSDEYFTSLPGDIKRAAWILCNEDITNELMKLELEYKIDRFINENFGLSVAANTALDDSVGKCAYALSGSEDLDITRLDKYLDKLLDSNCCLKRTKNTKNALGSDGYIEYTAKDLNISPEIVVKKIQENPYRLERVLKKYRNLLFHNYVLYCMGYNTAFGVTHKSESIKEIEEKFNVTFGGHELGDWIENYFNEIHSEIFKGKPYLIFSRGEIHVVN